MATRHRVGAGLLAVCVLAGWLPRGASGQEPAGPQAQAPQMSPAELLVRGLELLENGQVEKSKLTLQQIDVTKLNKAERGDLQEALRRVSRLERQAPARAAPVEPKPAPVSEPPPPAPAPEPQPKPEVAPAKPAPAPAPEPKAEPQPEPKAEAPPPAAPEAPAKPNGSLIRQAATVRAQELVAEGDEAKRLGQYNRALRLYEEALSINEGNEPAQRGREDVLALLGREAQPRLLDQTSAVFKLRNEQTKASYEEAMRLAVDSRAAGNYTQAEDYATRARAILDSSRQWLTEVEYDTRVKAVGQFLAGIREAAAGQAERRKREELRKRAAEQTRERLEAEQAAEARIQELIRRAADLRKELRYEEALDVLEQALFLEPNNVVVQAMKGMIEDSIIDRNERDIGRKQRLLIAKHANANREAAEPHTELILYPPDWPQISALRRGYATKGQGESEAKLVAMGRLQQPIADVPFEDTPFLEALKFIQDQTGVSIVPNRAALEGAGVEMEKPITLKLTKIPAARVLKLVLDQVGGELTPLDFAVTDDGIVNVSTVESLGRDTLVRSYDINDLIQEIPDFTDAPQFNLQQITQQSNQQGFGGNTGQGGGGGGRAGGQGGLFSQQNQGQQREQRTRTERAQDIVKLIQETVDPESWRSAGGVVGSVTELQGQLIIRTTEKNHRDIVGLLDQLREQRAIMINVEGRFLLVDQNYLSEIGMDIDVTLTNGLVGPLGFQGPITIKQDSLTIADRQNTGLPGSFGVGSGATTTPGGTGGTGGTGTGGGGGTGGTGAANASAFSRALDIQGTFLNDVQVDFLIRATQANRRAINLSAPRVTIFNGQQAYVTVATQTAYVANLTAVTGTGAVGLNPTIQVVQSGVILNVQGTVSADRRYVTLTLQPQLSSVGQIRQIQQVLAVAGGANNVGGGTGGNAGLATGIIEAPTTDLTTVATTVSVPDRGTLLLGGQRLWAEIEVEAGIPVLSKIPILNRLTTNRSTIKDERTLLILVKPTIIIQSEKEEELFPGSAVSPETFPATPAP